MTKAIQLKLTNGDEIMCKVHRKNWITGIWKIKHALMFIRQVNPETGTSYYAFVPYMTQQNHKDDIIELRSSQILSVAKPATLTEATYEKYVNNEHEHALAREKMTPELMERIKNPPPPAPIAEDQKRDINVTYEIDKSKLN